MRNKIHKNRLSLFVGLAVFGSLVLATSQISAYAASKGANIAPAQAAVACGVLENGDFENGTDSWIESGDWELVAGETGQAIAISNPALRQLIDASADEAFTLTGVYKTEGAGDGNWTGIGVDFLNGEEKLGNSLLQITEAEADFVEFSIEGTTPANTTSIIVWLYSNNGLVLIVDNIELTWEDCEEAPEPTETPVTPIETPVTPDPPTSGDYCEPLENGGFDDGINPWIVSGQWEIVPGRTGSAVAIETPFVRQNLDTVPGKTFTAQGYLRTEGVFETNWTGVGVDYKNSKSVKIGGESIRITEAADEYQLFEIAGTVPENATSAELWLYSGNGVTLFVDDIVFVWDDCSTEVPATPTPGTPAETATPEPTEVPTETPVPTPTQEPEPPANLETEMIYDEAVSENWTLGSWGTVSKNPLNKDPVFTGENSLEVSLANAWSTLFFEAIASDRADKTYSVEFDVYGTASSVQTFEIELLTKNYQQITVATVTVLPNQWSKVEVMFTDIDTEENLGYITLKNASTGDPFYIDNLAIMILPESPVGILDQQIYLPIVSR